MHTQKAWRSLVWAAIVGGVALSAGSAHALVANPNECDRDPPNEIISNVGGVVTFYDYTFLRAETETCWNQPSNSIVMSYCATTCNYHRATWRQEQGSSTMYLIGSANITRKNQYRTDLPFWTSGTYRIQNRWYQDFGTGYLHEEDNYNAGVEPKEPTRYGDALRGWWTNHWTVTIRDNAPGPKGGPNLPYVRAVIRNRVFTSFGPAGFWKTEYLLEPSELGGVKCYRVYQYPFPVEDNIRTDDVQVSGKAMHIENQRGQVDLTPVRETPGWWSACWVFKKMP